MLHFPSMYSWGNPRARPEESNAPASIIPAPHPVDKWKKPPHPRFPLACSRPCVCMQAGGCVCVCVHSPWPLALHGHLMWERLRDACMQAGVTIKGRNSSFLHHATTPPHILSPSPLLCFYQLFPNAAQQGFFPLLLPLTTNKSSNIYNN